jgi:hypothetical protein
LLAGIRFFYVGFVFIFIKIILFSIKIRDFLVQEVFVFLLELREGIFFFNLALISLEVKNLCSISLFGK